LECCRFDEEDSEDGFLSTVWMMDEFSRLKKSGVVPVYNTGVDEGISIG